MSRVQHGIGKVRTQALGGPHEVRAAHGVKDPALLAGAANTVWWLHSYAYVQP
jgi:hypothetical protein